MMAQRVCVGCWALVTSTAAAQRSDRPLPVSPDSASVAVGTPIVTPGWDVTAVQPNEVLLSLRLDRALTADDGRLAVIVGHSDLSSLLEMRGTIVRLPLRGDVRGTGTAAVSVYLVRLNGEWQELGVFPLRRRTRLGLDSAAFTPRLDGQSEGQLDSRFPNDAPPPRAMPFQDVSWNGGVSAHWKRGGWSSDLQSLIVVVPRKATRLRASTLGASAPVADLASYALSLVRGPVALSAGHLSVGRDRLLVSDFRSRGVAAKIGLGRVGQLDLATVAGSEIVGWDDPVGLARPSHRVQTATLALEALPSQPGLLHAEFSALRGSLQPITSFTQQAVTDRETSEGYGSSLVAALPSQRARLSLGAAQSRFDNPADRLLAGDTSIVAVEASARWARYAELTVDLLRRHRIAGLATSLQLIGRHQNTDPLYRSVATFMTADQRENAVELAGGLGLMQVQGRVGQSRDNLANIPTLLVTRSRAQSLSLTLPIGQLGALVTAGPWLPTLSLAWQGNGQRGDAIPDSAGFRVESQRPDQYSTNGTVQLGWQHARWTIAARLNRSFVDNRQSGRETSDFRTRVHAVTVALTPTQALSVTIDLSDERQQRLEQRTDARSQRAAMQVDWRPFRLTTVGGAWSVILSDDAAATTRGQNDEFRMELSQGLPLFRRASTGAPARAFLRFARTGVTNRRDGALQPPTREWTLAGGVNARVL